MVATLVSGTVSDEGEIDLGGAYQFYWAYLEVLTPPNPRDILSETTPERLTRQGWVAVADGNHFVLNEMFWLNFEKNLWQPSIQPYFQYFIYHLAPGVSIYYDVQGN